MALASTMLCISVGFAGSVAVAKKISGGKRGDRIAGTKKADRINGRGGPDRINARGGRDRVMGGRGADRIMGGPGVDRLFGGPGADRLAGGPGGDRVRGGTGPDRLIGGRGPDLVVGGKGLDRHLGGPGPDRINAVDGRRDHVINGGPGRDVCRLDTTLELSRARGCETIRGGGGPGPGPGPGDGLRVIGAVGLSCGSQLPTCLFQIEGDGADAPLGLITEGGGGVSLALGASLAITGSEWTAIGLYGCTGDGFIRVEIGEEHVDVPITCTS